MRKLRKENSNDYILEQLRELAWNKKKMVAWQAQLNKKIVCHASIDQLLSSTKKIIVDLDWKSKSEKIYNPFINLYLKSADQNIGFKCEQFKYLDKNKIILPIPKKLIMEEKRDFARYRAEQNDVSINIA
ncbi:hypothetical protein N9O57_02135, partial [bacterium]|nr:hypothetical protein [bacterium]